MTGHVNLAWAAAFLDELARCGVRDVCVAPGSRSSPLVLAAAADERFRMHTHLDERSAGFFGLGVGKGAGMPAAVVTTSGTASANLLPAVIEAAQAEVPLLVLTADRPRWLRGADANQAIDQVGLYRPYVKFDVDLGHPSSEERQLRHLRSTACRAVAATLGLPAGPVHVNFPFAKPLHPRAGEKSRGSGGGEARTDAPDGDLAPGRDGRPDGEPFTRISLRRSVAAPAEMDRLEAVMTGSARVILVAGPSSDHGRMGPSALRLAQRSGAPLLADPLSGARFCPSNGALLISHYDLFLRDPDIRRMLAPDVVIRVGLSPTSASLCTFLEEHEDAHHIVIDPGTRWKDHLALTTDYVRADAAHAFENLTTRIPSRAAGGWPPLWGWAEGVARSAVGAELRGEGFEGTVVASIVQELAEDTNLFVSNSMPVRDLDSWASPTDASIRVMGNRGASGIDGIVSTVLGIADGTEGPTVAIVGDVAFYHDMNGLLAARATDADVLFVVINNDGGGIFHLLPIREHEPYFTPYFAMPHGLDFAHAAAMYGIPFQRVQTVDSFPEAFRRARDGSGVRILEVSSDRESNSRRHREVVGVVRAALRDDSARAIRELSSPGPTASGGGSDSEAHDPNRVG